MEASLNSIVVLSFQVITACGLRAASGYLLPVGQGHSHGTRQSFGGREVTAKPSLPVMCHKVLVVPQPWWGD